MSQHRSLARCRWLLLRLVVALLCLLPLVAHSARLRPGQQAAVHLSSQARAAYDRGDYAAAENLYRLALETDPAQPAYLYGIGKSAAMAGRCEDARKAFGALHQRLPAGHELLQRAQQALQTCRSAGAEQPAPAPAPAPARAPAPAPDRVTDRAPAPAPARAPVAAGADAPAALPPSDSLRSPGPRFPALAPSQLAAIPSARDSASPPWTLWAGAGLAAAATGLGGWSAWATADLDRQLGSLSGPAARAEQADINSATTAAVVVGTAAAVALVHGLWQWLK